MTEIQGNLLKMNAKLDDVVQYYLPIGDSIVPLNELIGRTLNFEYQGRINCLACGKETPKSFAQGYCYPCFVSVPETSECGLRPELCEAHLGISRDMKWSETHCLSDHYVYLAISSGLKVGVTRASQIPTRWIDQGACKAIKLAMTPNRYTAGIIEVELKNYFSDKTSWQKMLKNNIDRSIDLEEAKQQAWEYLDEELQAYVIDDDEITEITYPVENYPTKVKSIGFDKVPKFEKVLTGIKGQYLIFDNTFVLNIRKHSGYHITLKY